MESTDNTNQVLTTQQVHAHGISLALAAAKSHNDDIVIVECNGSTKYYAKTDYGLREVIFCCSTSNKNGNKIHHNITAREYRNRVVDVGKYNDKVYILVHMDLLNNKNRFFKITHQDLCLLQYYRDCTRSNRNYNMATWLCGGKGRSNIECDILNAGGYGVWK